MDEVKDDDDRNNINIEPSPFAPSDISISGINTPKSSSHLNTIILREKVVLVGDSTVGKSSLAQSFLSQGIEMLSNREYSMTSGVDMNVKTVHIPNSNIDVDLFIYDSAGQSIFNQQEIASKYWNECSYIVCVFDVSSRKSFQSCETWIQAVQASQSRNRGDHTQIESIPVVLIANKVDLREDDDSIIVVDQEEISQFAKENQYEHFDCSTRNSAEVDAPFLHIATQSAKRYQESRDVDHNWE